MRKLSGLLAAAVLIVGASAPASAAVVSMENSVLSVVIGALPPITIGQTPGSIPINVSSGGGNIPLPASAFAATVILPTQLFTGVSLISSLNVTVQNGAGTFTPIGGQASAFGGAAAIQGQSVVGVLAGLINLVIPLTVVGTGGVVQAGAAALLVTVTGHLWTTGVAAVTAVTSPTTATLAGYDNRTNTSHGGAIQLISPIRILTNAAGNLPGFAIKTLRFVPEPGGLMLLGSAIAGLLTVGWLRMRR
ncbi:MAG: hypothetical protein O7A09_03670 [Proteobacteria bacterium]|nr:hypothetical protein [Pseudomonadota bacterium]